MFEWFGAFWQWLLVALGRLLAMPAELAGSVLTWLVGILNGGLVQLVSAFPDITLPSWFASGPAAISQLMTMVGQLSYWFPSEMFTPFLVWNGAVLVIALGIRIARIVASFATLGGGA